MENEIWRPVPSHPAYSVSSYGRVRREAPIISGWGSRRPAGQILKPNVLPKGYLRVVMSVGCKQSSRLVHRLVASAFLAEPDAGKTYVCHRDDDPTNNRPENLFWGSPLDNARDMCSKGRQARGARSGASRLKDADVIAIRSRWMNGESQTSIAVTYSISSSHISQMITGRIWGHLK